MTDVVAADRYQPLVAIAGLVAGTAALATLPSPAAATPVDEDHDCMGRWVGEGENTGSPSPWTIELTLTSAPSGERCGTIEYGEPDCGGTLESCEVVDGAIHAVERYTHGEASCAAPGRLILRCDGERMRYAWLGWERVDSVLHRPKGWQEAQGGRGAERSDRGGTEGGGVQRQGSEETATGGAQRHGPEERAPEPDDAERPPGQRSPSGCLPAMDGDGCASGCVATGSPGGVALPLWLAAGALWWRARHRSRRVRSSTGRSAQSASRGQLTSTSRLRP